MAEEKTVFGTAPDRKEILFTQGAIHMARGAAYGAALFFGVLILIWVISLVGSWLPEDSKNMPDPHNRGAIEAPLQGPGLSHA